MVLIANDVAERMSRGGVLLFRVFDERLLVFTALKILFCTRSENIDGLQNYDRHPIILPLMLPHGSDPVTHPPNAVVFISFECLYRDYMSGFVA